MQYTNHHMQHIRLTLVYDQVCYRKKIAFFNILKPWFYTNHGINKKNQLNQIKTPLKTNCISVLLKKNKNSEAPKAPILKKTP